MFIFADLYLLKYFIMKRMLYIIMSAVWIVSCQTSPKYLINGTIEGMENGLVTLEKRVDGQWVTMDSAQLDKGSFRFAGALATPEMVYLSVSGINGKIPFFLENSKIGISFHPDSMDNALITGSASHDLYLAYQDGQKTFQEKARSLSDEYAEAQNRGDEAQTKEIGKKFDDLWAEQIGFTRDFIAANPASIVSAYLIRTQLMYEMEWEELDSITNTLDSSLAASDYVRFLRERVDVLRRVAVGQAAPDFTQNDPDGNPVALSSMVGKSKLLLVDFWASWCGPCRAENPNVVAVFNEFKDKGFNVLGVSLDRNREEWLKGIEEDKLDWTHVSDIRFWDNAAAKLYGVMSIPHNLLLDDKGVILAKNLRGEDLRQKVDDLL